MTIIHLGALKVKTQAPRWEGASWIGIVYNRLECGIIPLLGQDFRRLGRVKSGRGETGWLATKLTVDKSEKSDTI